MIKKLIQKRAWSSEKQALRNNRRGIREMEAATIMPRMTTLAATLIVTLMMTACSNETDQYQRNDQYTYEGEPIPIELSTGSIENYGAGPVTRSGQTSESFCEPLDDDYNMVTTIESIPDSTNKPQTRSVLPNGIRFRVVAYRNDDVKTANYAGMADYYINGNGGAAVLVNANAPLALKQGLYKFVCYSYNTPTNISDGFNGSAATAINVNQGTDFSSHTFSANVTPDVNGTFTLPAITLQRMCSKVYISVVSISGNVTSCSATISNVNSNAVSWALGTADLPNTGTGGVANLTWSSPNAATVNSSAQYLLPNNSRTVTISLNMIVAGKPYNNNTFTIASRSFTKGTYYKITANVKKNTIEIDGLPFKVATGNVVLRGGKYQFQPTQGDYSYQWNGGDYFNWGTSDPNNYTVSNGYFAEDVCKKIGAQWRTPSQNEYMSFVNYSPKGIGTYYGANRGNIKGYYFGGNPGSINSSNQNSYVFLPLAGNRDNGSQSMGYEGSSGLYWSSTPRSGNACYLSFYSDGSLYGTYSSRPNGGFTVRCVTGEV